MTNQKAEDREAAVLSQARAAWLAAPLLAASNHDQRNQAIALFKEIINRERLKIIETNREDAERSGLAPAEFKAGRMSIDNAKIDTLMSGFDALLAMDDPIGNVDLARELDNGLNLYRVTCPVGVIGIIFEARPDALPQIAALAVKSGNAVLLKGGSEVETTNRALFACLEEALGRAGLPQGCASLLAGRAEVEAMLKADKFIDLIIPRGSNALVSYIQSNTRIPVLGHAEGICHVYVHHSADLTKALTVVLDAKLDYPSACNSAEVLLLDRLLDDNSKITLLKALHEKQVQLHLTDSLLNLAKQAGLAEDRLKLAAPGDFDHEWGSLVMSVCEVEGSGEAVTHINQHSSGHTESIVCEDETAWREFFTQIRSAGVYRNASTRFADGFRYGFGAEVGISTSKMPPRGPVGLEGLTTYKYKLEGDGHAVSEYSRGERRFTHKKLPIK